MTFDYGIRYISKRRAFTNVFNHSGCMFSTDAKLLRQEFNSCIATVSLLFLNNVTKNCSIGKVNFIFLHIGIRREWACLI